MAKRKGLGPKQHFKIDGKKLFIRRAQCNPGFVQRVDDKILEGEYKHVETTGDVEVYEIGDASPLRRATLSHLTMRDIEMAIITAACKRDFALYHDACSELAVRYRTNASGEELPTGTARTLYVEHMAYIELRILRRGGPSEFEIKRELGAINERKRGRKIVVAPTLQ